MIPTGSCRPQKADTPAVSASSSLENSTMGNPAAQKCVNDGFVLTPVVEQGVPVKYMCSNPSTGLKCEVWAYFKNQCRLGSPKKGAKE